jgi:hypothetical protein
MSLHSKRYDIIQNCFQASKPSYLVSSKPQQDTSDDEEKEMTKKKKLKANKDHPKPNKDLGSLVRNPDTNIDWIVSKNYKLIFHKGANKFTPLFNDQGLTTCNKWHVQGYCFEVCEIKASHKECANESL